MRSIGIYTLIFFGLFYFSEGKPCPDKTRPHKTRCDAYYKCQDIPPKAHVWIPSVCDQGLIYEHNLKLCVLPEDDWECVLEDSVTASKVPKKATTLQKAATEEIEPDLRTNKDSDVDIVSSEQVDSMNDDSIQLIADNSRSSEEVNDDVDYESSGNGEALMELNDVLQAETRETNDKIIVTDSLEHKESESSVPSSSNIDPKLTAHLQRLSQLIDGLKQTYQNQDNKQTELRPDQLNAFLAHFNIKNKFNNLNPSTEDDLQHSILAVTSSPLNISSRFNKLQATLKNKTDLQEHQSNKMKPETKLLLSSAMSKRYGSPGGFSSSQIVVNHPEGSVMFSLPSYGNDQNFVETSHVYESHNSPKISEDTLKTVLELSKQMIANQNVPKVIQNPAYYPQPILQPVYLSTASFPGSHGSPFSSYFNSNNQNNNNNNHGDYNEDNRYSSATNSHHYKPYGHKHGHNHGHNTHGQNSNNGYSKPSTTVIHNNIIPVHVTSTNSGEKEIIDSYGQSLGHYPPLNVGENDKNDRYNQHHSHFSHLYEGNNFLTSFTTKRPSAATTPSDHYSGQYPSPYPTEISMTTMPSLVSEYYTPSEHLNENNVHHLYQSSEHHHQTQYGTMPRPMDSNQVERPNQPQQPFYGQNQQNQLISSQISSNVKIRPSGQKVESMEMNASVEDSSYDEQPMVNQQSFSYNNNNNGLSNQYGFTMNTGNNNNHKQPYMPRPHVGSSSTSYGSSLSMVSKNKPKFPSYGSSSSHFVDGTQLVNVGGNFIRYDVFQNTILPMLGHSQNDELNNVEVITCATGIRQPNTTDCTRYYVCSKKDGKVLSYSCPPYTAFNAQTRICDARTYSLCTPSAIANSYTVTENKRIQMEAFQALQEAKRRREQALKAQSISNLLQQYDAQLNPSTSSESGNSQEKDMLNAYVQQAAIMANMVTSTVRPTKKRKYYCKEGDKIPDQTSIYSYFVCYKNAQGMMKGHKMTCSKGLLFCPKTTMCTLSTKCS